MSTMPFKLMQFGGLGLSTLVGLGILKVSELVNEY